MTENKMNDDHQYDAVIADLCADLAPVKPFMHPLKSSILMIIAVLIYVLAASLLMGCREDMADKYKDPVFIFEIIYTAILGVTAMLAAHWLRYPDMRQNKTIQKIPIWLLIGFIGWVAWRFVQENFVWVVSATWWRECFAEAALVSLMPVMMSILVLQRNASVAPVRMMSMLMLSLAAFGWIGLRATCGMDNAAHVFCILYLPFVLAGIVAAMAAKRLFRW